MSIKYIFLFFIITVSFCNSNEYITKPFTIMINPAGDAKDIGRTLNDSFERGITLQFSQELKKNLELLFPKIRVVLTRIPGETLEVLQNANFANRLQADFYFSIHFYKEQSNKSQFFLYHYIQNPFFSTSRLPILNFYNFDNAYLINISKTIKYVDKFKQVFESYKNKFDFKGIFAIPFKPLVGIKAPAIALEISLKNSIDWSLYVQPVIEAITSVINSIEYN